MGRQAAGLSLPHHRFSQARKLPILMVSGKPIGVAEPYSFIEAC